MPETLAHFVKRAGLSSAPRAKQVDAWYKEAYGAEPDIREDPYVIVMHEFYEGVDPKPIGIIDEREEFLKPYYIEGPKDLYQRIEHEAEDAHWIPYNRKAMDRERRGVSKRPFEDMTVDYLGVPPEGRGSTAREKNFWIGKVYIHNMEANGKRRNGVLSDKLGAYFGVTERTIRRCAKFAEAAELVGEMKHTLARTMDAAKMNRISGDWVLKPLKFPKWIPPWKLCDNGADASYDAKEIALRLCPK